MKKILFAILYVTLTVALSKANKIDSLQLLLQSETLTETERFNANKYLCYLYLGNNKKLGKKHGELAYQSAKKNKYDTLSLFLYLSVHYFKAGEYHNGLLYLNKVEKAAYQRNEFGHLAGAYLNKGFKYADLGLNKKAFYQKYKAFKISQKHQIQETELSAAKALLDLSYLLPQDSVKHLRNLIFNIARNKLDFEINRKGSIQTVLEFYWLNAQEMLIENPLNDTTKGLALLDTVMVLGSRFNLIKLYSKALSTYINFYINNNELSKAHEYVVKLKNIDFDNLDLRVKKTVTEQLGNYYKTIGKYDKALTFLEVNKSLIDSIKSETLAKKLLQQKYQKDKLDFEAKLADVKRSSYLKSVNVILISVLVVVLVTIISLYFYRRNKIEAVKKEQVLSTENNKLAVEREKLLKRINELKLKSEITQIAVKPEAYTGQTTGLKLDHVQHVLNIKLNETDKKVIGILYKKPMVLNKEIANQVSLSVEGVSSSLRKMYRLLEITETQNKKIALLAKALQVSNES